MATLGFCIPFTGAPFSWLEMNLYFQGLVFFLTAALLYHACLSLGVRNALLLFVICLFLSYVAEYTGIQWGWIFGGRYHYHPGLIPRLPGGVPFFIPLIWFVLIYTACVFLGPLSIRPQGSLSSGRLLSKTVLCSLYVMTTDFFLDPLGVYSGAWVWREPGGYFGTPIRNFAGWFLVGLAVSGSYLLLEKPLPNGRLKERIAQDAAFVIFSVFLTALCFTGCIIFFGVGLPVVLPLTVMGPCWVYWATSARPSSRNEVNLASATYSALMTRKGS